MTSVCPLASWQGSSQTMCIMTFMVLSRLCSVQFEMFHLFSFFFFLSYWFVTYVQSFSHLSLLCWSSHKSTKFIQNTRTFINPAESLTDSNNPLLSKQKKCLSSVITCFQTKCRWQHYVSSDGWGHSRHSLYFISFLLRQLEVIWVVLTEKKKILHRRWSVFLTTFYC